MCKLMEKGRAEESPVPCFPLFLSGGSTKQHAGTQSNAGLFYSTGENKTSLKICFSVQVRVGVLGEGGQMSEYILGQ